MINPEILAHVKKIEIRTKRLVDQLTAGAYQSSFKGQGVEFAEVREYTEGDDVRSIDWNVTAKMGTPFIKQFTEERELSVSLLVDISGSGDFGSVKRSKNDLATELATLLAFSAIRNKDKVGLMLFTDREELHLPARKGRRHVLRLCREMLVHQRQSAKTDINHAIQKFMQVTPRKNVVFLISDLMGDDFEQNLLLLSRKHDVIVIHISDPLEEELPRNLYIAMEDSEDSSFGFLKALGKGKRRQFKERAEAKLAENQAVCKRCGVELIALRTDEDYVNPLMLFFKRRGAKR